MKGKLDPDQVAQVSASVHQVHGKVMDLNPKTLRRQRVCVNLPSCVLFSTYQVGNVWQLSHVFKKRSVKGDRGKATGRAWILQELPFAGTSLDPKAYGREALLLF